MRYVLSALFLGLAAVPSAHAVNPTVFVECTPCSASEMRIAAGDSGDGIRYIFDLSTGAIRKYAVSNTTTGVPNIVEQTVDSTGIGVASKLRNARIADPNFAKFITLTTRPISVISGGPYRPAAVAWSNGNFNAFATNVLLYLQGPNGPESAANFLSASSQASSVTGTTSGAPLPNTQTPLNGGGGKISFQLTDEVFEIHLTDETGYVVIKVYASGLVAYAGAYDPEGHQYPDKNVAMPNTSPTGTSTINWTFGSLAAFTNFQAQLNNEGLNVSGQGSSYISCAYKQATREFIGCVK